MNAATLKWFKIDEAGLLSGTIGNGYWGAGKMIDQNSSWTTTIPATVPSGNYLIRFETIALHSMPAVSVTVIDHAAEERMLTTLYSAILPRVRADPDHWWRQPCTYRRRTRDLPRCLQQH